MWRLLLIGAIFYVSAFAVVPDVVSAQTPGSFSTTWDTSIEATSGNNQIIIPFSSQAGVLDIYWEDVASSTTNGTTTVSALMNTVTFPSEGIYRVDITSTFNYGLSFVDGGDQNKLLTVEQWGDNQWPTVVNMFAGAANLTSLPVAEAPDLTALTSLHRMFASTDSFDGPLDHWDVSGITDFSFMFFLAPSFDQPLNGWNIGSATTTQGMFFGASTFDQPLNGWNTSNIINMESMFLNAALFDQPLDNWDVTMVADMDNVFTNATNFNQSLNSWETINLISARRVFDGASTFNQSLGNWDLSNVIDDGENNGMANIFRDTAIDIANYSDTLAAWASSTIPTNVNIGTVSNSSGLVPYFSLVEADRNTLIANGWTIIDGGSVQAFTLDYDPTDNAILVGNANQTVASGTSGTEVRVVPDAGYEFVQWSDGVTDNPRIEAVVTASVSVAAVVAEQPSGSSGTRVDRNRNKDKEENESQTMERAVVGVEGINILNMTPQELEELPDDQKRQAVNILLTLIAILTEILNLMMAGLTES